MNIVNNNEISIGEAKINKLHKCLKYMYGCKLSYLET